MRALKAITVLSMIAFFVLYPAMDEVCKVWVVISGVVLLFACVKFNPGNFVNENFSFICYIISCIFIFTGTMWYMNDSEKG